MFFILFCIILFTKYETVRPWSTNDTSGRPLRRETSPRRKGQFELFEKLFQNHNHMVRPLQHSNESIVIYFELFIAQLVAVDEGGIIFSFFATLLSKTHLGWSNSGN